MFEMKIQRQSENWSKQNNFNEGVAFLFYPRLEDSGVLLNFCLVTAEQTV